MNLGIHKFSGYNRNTNKSKNGNKYLMNWHKRKWERKTEDKRFDKWEEST